MLKKEEKYSSHFKVFFSFQSILLIFKYLIFILYCSYICYAPLCTQTSYTSQLLRIMLAITVTQRLRHTEQTPPPFSSFVSSQSMLQNFMAD